MVTIYKATEEDIELIGKLADVAFNHTYVNILSRQQREYMFEMMYSPRNIEKQMQEGCQYYVATFKGRPSGYLSIREKAAGLYYIDKIYTLPDIYGVGVGRSLFEFACNFALEQSTEKRCKLELNVNRHNKRAISFYLKMGMEVARQTDEHVGGGYYANDYVMTKYLKR